MPNSSDNKNDSIITYRNVFIIWFICFVIFLIFLWSGPGILDTIMWNQPENSLILGEKYLNEGKLGSAYKKLNEAIKVFPINPHAHYLLGVANMKLKHLDQAMKEFEISLDYDAKNPQADSELKQLYTELGRTAEAQIYSDKISIQDAQQNIDKKDFQKVENILSSIPVESPYYPQARTLLAITQSQNGQLDAAIKELQKIISLDSTQEDALQTLADLYEEKGLKQQSEMMRNKANELVPSISVNHNLVNRLIFLGYDIKPNRIGTGQSFDITYYWKCLSLFKKKLIVGVQFYDAKGEIPFTNWHDPLNGVYPTTNWKPGEIIKEKYTVTVPPNAPLGTYEIIMQMCLPNGQDQIGRSDSKDGKFKAGELTVIERK